MPSAGPNVWDMTNTEYKNRQHATDELLAVWVPDGKGSARVYTNYDGWTISKKDGGWIITRPNSFRADRSIYPSLFEAKYQVANRLALQDVA